MNDIYTLKKMTFVIPSRSNQDRAWSGRVGDMDYIMVADGHGTNKCIHQLSTMNMDEIASSENPVLAASTQLQGDLYGSGATFAVGRRFPTRVELFNCGDTCIELYINGKKVYRSTQHTFTNSAEVERTKSLVSKIVQTLAPFPVSYTEVKDILSPLGHFNTGEKMVPSQSLGHNNMSGLAPDVYVHEVSPMDHVRMVAGSDGFWDMLVSTENGTAKELAEHAHRQWLKKWDYMWNGRMSQTDYGGEIDDISVAIYEDRIKEFPSLCIPTSPLAFTVDQVRATVDAILGGVRKIDEIVYPTHKVFFIHFNPTELNDVHRKIYSAGHDGCKLYYGDEWFWMLKRSNYAGPMRGVDDVYELWDKTGDYYTLYDTHVPHHAYSKMTHFLTEIKK
jgi:serine/threonine protein phosphatase PrpC